MKYFHLPVMAAGLLAAVSVWAAQPVDVMIDAIHPGAIIDKHLYGQVAAHSASGDAGAMWVGPASKIANIKGWRKDVVAALKDLRTPLLRWPGGCQTDQYNWRDGIGARAKRAAVGTHEFFDLVELLGADAYVNGNVGTGSAREAAEWVEYMVAQGGSTLALLRAKNGHAQPFKVAYFGVGNAPWGCGGNMTAQYYADLYNQFAVFIRGKGDQAPLLVASGSGAEWTAELGAKKRIRDYRFAISATRQGSKDAGAGEDGWISAMNRALQINEFIDSNVAMLDKNDTAHKASLAIGEWGGRDDPAPQHQNALRDALVATLHFHAFHAHAARLSMANTPQVMIQAKGSTMVLTPTYYAFRMHVPFQGATSLPVTLGNNPQYAVGGVAIPTVSASAARARDGKLYLSLVNTNPNESVAVAVEVTGAMAKAASGGVLTAGAMDVPLLARGDQGKLLLTLKAKSVTVLAIQE